MSVSHLHTSLSNIIAEHGVRYLLSYHELQEGVMSGFVVGFGDKFLWYVCELD